MMGHTKKGRVMKSVLLLSVLLAACGGSNQSRPSCGDADSCIYEGQNFKYEGPNHLGIEVVGKPEVFIKAGDYIAAFEFETGDTSPDGRVSFFTFGAPSETRLKVVNSESYTGAYKLRMQLYDGSYSEWVDITVEI